MSYTLRPYQVSLDAQVTEAWANGARNVLAVSPTGSGKTVFFAHCISRERGGSVAIAHRQELVSQISLALAREGVRHRIIGPDSVVRLCTSAHLDELGASFHDPGSRYAAAGVDTLVRLPATDPLFLQTALWVLDEAHHVLANNKWGECAKRFVNARGLGVTATPVRADGKGLGRHADGLFDAMVVGPSMRDLIEQGYLTEYRVFAPPSDLDLSKVSIGATGDYSAKPLKEARQHSHITGDVVAHYLRIARGKLGVTFDTDVESATQTAEAYRAAGVPAEVVSAKTPDSVRSGILRKFRNREVLQLVNVDLFGEGFDLPAIEVVSMARPTQSYSLFCLDPETEVLTPKGWAKADAALKAPAVIAFDVATGECREEFVTGSIRRPLLDGEVMYGVQSPHLDVCVSDQHRMVVRANSGSTRNWQFETAKQTSTRRSMAKVPVAGFGRFPGSGLSYAELRFLGWFLSDGSRHQKTNAITISQSSSKPAHLESIEQCLRECGFKYGKSESKRQGEFSHCPPAVLFTVSHGQPRGRCRHLRGYSDIAEWCDKTLPACYDRLTREELLVLLSTLYLGDGWNDHSRVSWTPRTMRIACGSNRLLADRLQALCVVRGLRCNLGTFRGPGGVDWHTAYVKDTATSSLPGTGTPDGSVAGKKTYRRSRFGPSAQRPDFVWCLTNALGTLITRRNGKVCITGNCQQFGRVLRLLDGKRHAIVIDHVGNVGRHGLPDAFREWSLDRRERQARSSPTDVIPVRTCLNPECVSVYERVLPACPYCGHAPVPTARSGPEYVDGDLHELSPDVLAKLRGDAGRLRGSWFPTPDGATVEVRRSLEKRHVANQSAQAHLEGAIALWAGWQKHLGRGDAETYRRFYHAFGVDVGTAVTLKAADAESLTERIRAQLQRNNVVSA